MTDPSHRWRAAALAAASLLPLQAAHAEPTIAELLQRLEEQEQKILVLERKLELEEEADKNAAGSNAIVKASTRGFSLQSADGQNQLKLRGVVHVDGRSLISDEPADVKDTWQATRMRPIIEGTLAGIYDFRFTPDFGQGRTVIQDAYVAGRFRPGAEVTAGKFKSPVGLERLQSATDIRFVTRGFPTSLAPNRDLGVQLGGKLLDNRLSYAVAWLNGSNDGASSEAFGDSDTNSDKEWAARLFAQPFAENDSIALRGLGLGIAGTYTNHEGTTSQTLLPAYRTPAQSTFFRYRAGTEPTLASGERIRWAPQFYYYFGPFGLLGEYTQVSQEVARVTTAGTREASLDTTAWQLAASWFLTGEDAAYRGFKPASVFSLENGTWGAFEIVGRYHELAVDDDAFTGGADSFADPGSSARKASAYGLGLNWYLNENLKWVFNCERTSFSDGAAGGADREDEEVFQTRFALGF
ncbi:MAG: porin [Steroidobacteraceae bacterium]